LLREDARVNIPAPRHRKVDQYDVVIVGAGSSGCVLASRLSEDPDRTVLLLDAGRDHPTLDDFPDDLARANSMAASFPGHPNNWSFVGEIVPGRNYPLARGKVVGGSSAVNGTYFIRGKRADFDHWAALGNDLWSYDQVLPSFRRSERDLDFATDHHGQDGPIPVRRPQDAELTPVSRAFIEACRRLGHGEDHDKNDPDSEGVGRIPRNAVDGIRMNTALTYLSTARGRPNLTVLGESHVRRVLFEGTRAVGVEAERDGQLVTFRGDEIVLSAGGIKTPHLLLLSGVGPADQLRELGIDVVHDSPGVGRGVKDHPSVFMSFRVPDGRGQLPANFMPFQACLNYTAPNSTVDGDLQINCGSASYRQMLESSRRRFASAPSYLRRPLRTLAALRRLDKRLVYSQAKNQDNLTLLCSLDAEASEGSISLRSADPDQAPAISLNYLSDPADMPRVETNLRMALEILHSPEFRQLGAKPAEPVEHHFQSGAALREWIWKNIGTSFHTTSSARMGTDEAAVVDQHCRVRGVEGLRVVDISVMPTIVRRGTAATAVMIGERAAELMTSDTH
jgi:choline dehydrogenase-like flavoprotein